MKTPESSLIARCVILVGDYGSGKTEIAVNLARFLASKTSKTCVPSADSSCSNTPSENSDNNASCRTCGVSLADLDLVNPYFRCREASEDLERLGIEVVVPHGGHRFADLPILLPQVKGLLQNVAACRRAVLDVGGDEVGSRVLAGISDAYDTNLHALWFVVNANRPFNDTVEGVIRSIRRIEGASSLRVTGLVPNTHLMADTTVQMVRDGVLLAERVSECLGVPITMVAAMDGLAQQLGVDYPVLCMRRWMVPPWLRPGTVQLNPMGQTGPDVFRLRTS